MSQEFESISLTRSIVTLPRCALETQNLNLPKMSSQVSQYGTTDGANRALLDGWDNALQMPHLVQEVLVAADD